MGGLKVKDAHMGKLLSKAATIIGSTLRSRSDSYKADLIKKFSNDCLPGFEGDIPIFKPIVDRVLMLSEVAEAHRYVESNANIGKVVLINDL